MVDTSQAQGQGPRHILRF